MREVRYLDAARADLDAAVSWHETQRSRDAASLFLEQIGASVDRIVDLPLAWPVSKLDPRVRVRKLRRRPGYWLERVR